MYYLVHALLEIQMNNTYLMLIIWQAELRNLLIKTLPKSLFFYHSEEKHFFRSWNKKRFWSTVLINIAHSLVYLQSISSLCVKCQVHTSHSRVPDFCFLFKVFFFMKMYFQYYKVEASKLHFLQLKFVLMLRVSKPNIQNP